MQLYKGQTRAKPHRSALLQPDEPRTQSYSHNNYITVCPNQEPPQEPQDHALSQSHPTLCRRSPLFIVIWWTPAYL